MPYRPLGYRAISPGRKLIPAALHILNTLNGMGAAVRDTAIPKAMTSGFNPRTAIKAIYRDDWLSLRVDPVFAPDDMYISLMTVIYQMLASGGFHDYRPTALEYVSDPIMSIDEMINEALGQYLETKLPSSERYPNGEKTQIENFKGQVLFTLQELATIARKRQTLLSHFQRYIGNILYQMYEGTMTYTSLGAWEKSVLAIYVYNADPSKTTSYIGNSAGVPLNFPVARDTDPVLEESIARLKAVCKVGNWLNYTRIMSNKDPRELAAIIAPVVEKLPVATGFITNRGPFFDMDLKVTETLDWGHAEHLASYYQKLSFDDENQNVSAQFITTGWRLPSVFDSGTMPVLYDYPMVDLAFQAVSQTRDRLVASWQSPTYQRRISDMTGATADKLIVDLALASENTGAVDVSGMNVEAFKWVDLSDPSLGGRQITGYLTRQNRNAMVERIYYIRNGNIESANVNVTEMYLSEGNAGFRPALIEHMRVSKDWFKRPVESKYTDFLLGKLGLTKLDQKESLISISMSHNVAMFERLTGTLATSTGFQLLPYIETTTGKTRGTTATSPTTIS